LVTCTHGKLFSIFCCRCSSKDENKFPHQEENFIDKHGNEKDNENQVKRLKADDSKETVKSGNLLPTDTVGSENINPPISLESEKDPAPPFYFNLHRHSPKGPQLLRVDTVIQFLRKAGYRASRTHFDRGAVRTSASLSNLMEVLTQAANVN
jgi:hypothetical protein